MALNGPTVCVRSKSVKRAGMQITLALLQVLGKLYIYIYICDDRQSKLL